MISIIQTIIENQASDDSTVKGRVTKIGIAGGLIGSELGLRKGQKHFSKYSDILKKAKESKDDIADAQDISDKFKAFRPTHITGSALKKTGKMMFGGDDE